MVKQTKLHIDTARVLTIPRDHGGFGFTQLSEVQREAIPVSHRLAV